MGASVSSLTNILEGHAPLWKQLRGRDIVVSTARGGERALCRAGDIEAEAAVLAEASVEAEALAVLCAAFAEAELGSPCAVDLLQALQLVRRQKIAPAEAIVRSRIRYFGTDGVRGKVASDREGVSPLAALVEEGLFTPGLCRLLSAALVIYRSPTASPTVVVAEDGRDAFGERAYAQATIGAFKRLGCRVIDLGVAPTPLVSAACAVLGAELGAAVTASHNPANQNGIKFFHHGRKLLPEPDDCALSAHAFLAQLDGLPDEISGGGVSERDAGELLAGYVRSAVPDEDVAALGDALFVVDCAHGAFAPYAAAVFEQLGLAAEIMNDDMTGENINRDSGVAYIEGEETIAGGDIDGQIALVGRTRELARSESRRVFGVALDGDGDRGLLLVYDAEPDAVHVIDGDRLGYILAGEWRSREGVFAGTVESDLAVFAAARALGVETVMTPVGDKWLSSEPGVAERLLVGEEASGHLVWPVEIENEDGEPRLVITGNGILTGLLGAAAIVRAGLSGRAAARPFEPGVCSTLYTYFVEKARLYRGSPVWRKDLEIAAEEVARLVRERLLPAGAGISPVSFENDPDMLYLKIEAAGSQVGAVFVRNSGTENKTATYARGAAEHAEGLTGMARAINRNHIAMMKDDRLFETAAGDAVADALGERGRLSPDETAAVAADHGVTGEADVAALVFALTKEGRARRDGEDLVCP